MVRTVATILAVHVIASQVCADDAVQYVLRFPDAKNHYLDVEARFPRGDQQSLELMMAVWTPGSYLVRDYARHLESVRAVDAEGTPLAIDKRSKNRWQVTMPTRQAGSTSETITVHYQVYCREMTVRTNWVEDRFAMLNGAPTFLTLADGLELPHQVQLVLPANWKLSITSLDRVTDGGPNHYQARDFDELVDSPILCGNPAVYSFDVGQREHLLVNQGEGGIWDGTKAANDVAKIVAEQHRIWGVVPYTRYIFFNLITEAGGGLEHDNSTLMMTSRWSFRQRESYLRWLGLVSHEFFHTWNIRRLRPQPLVQYDYERENYTHSLWIAEGITSYYDNLTLIRSGVCSQKEYLRLLSRDIESLQTTPGRLGQSLRDSSYDTWIKFYRPDENSRNSRISYYTKGAVVAFLLDAHIRKSSSDAKSLDDVMRTLYQRHSGNRGYTPDDFRSISSQMAGQDLSDWFARMVDSSGELNYEEALDWYGLKFGGVEAKEDSDNANGKPAGEPSDSSNAQPAWLGISTSTEDGKLIVSRVLRDSPAFRAGLNPDDEIVALGKYRVSPGQWESRLKQFRPGDTETFLIARRDLLTSMDITFGTKPPPDQWRLAPVAKPSEHQQRHRQSWLKTDKDAAQQLTQ